MYQTLQFSHAYALVLYQHQKVNLSNSPPCNVPSFSEVHETQAVCIPTFPIL